ncbi:MAG TPA: hypothetical protein VFY98_15920, partial [Intrasporangium sp.]|nr:hypothetical protein [Intrasporangium sp.]
MRPGAGRRDFIGCRVVMVRLVDGLPRAATPVLVRSGRLLSVVGLGEGLGLGCARGTAGAP